MARNKFKTGPITSLVQGSGLLQTDVIQGELFTETFTRSDVTNFDGWTVSGLIRPASGQTRDSLVVDKTGAGLILPIAVQPGTNQYIVSFGHYETVGGTLEALGDELTSTAIIDELGEVAWYLYEITETSPAGDSVEKNIRGLICVKLTLV